MKRHYHVCSLLKDLTRRLYYYDDETEWLDAVFVYLDYVLVCNQYITNSFTEVLKHEIGHNEFYTHYKSGLFPQYLREYDEEIVKIHIDRINEERENIPAKAVDGEVEISLYDLTKHDLLDLRKPYSEIISILKYYEDPLLEGAEYGYYIGSLLKLKADEWLKEYGEGIFIEPDFNVLERRIDTFREGVFCTLDGEECEDYEGWHKQHKEKKAK